MSKQIEKLTTKLCDLVDKTTKIFEDEFKKDKESGWYVLLALLGGPISFTMSIFKSMDEMGIEPNKEFPTFIKVYINYLRSLEKMEEDWHRLPFPEFRRKFEKVYKDYGILLKDNDE